jgi:IclR family transcriptional regulator, pca regulon regulatory protein
MRQEVSERVFNCYKKGNRLKKSSHPDFIEALARGLEVIQSFRSAEGFLSLSEVATLSNLPRPTARRILYTLAELGFVRVEDGAFTLTPKVMDLGMAFVTSKSLWDITRTHLEALARGTGHSTSIALLEGSDVLYVSRVAVPKLVGLNASVGTRFPAYVTSLGKVLLAPLAKDELDRVLAIPSLSGVTPSAPPTRAQLDLELRDCRAKGWTLTDQQLAPTVLSIAAPIRDAQGKVVAALNVNAHAYETDDKQLISRDLPLLLEAAANVSNDWAQFESQPSKTLG